MSTLSIRQIVSTARMRTAVVPAFNIPYLPMMAPVVDALRDTCTFGMIAVARLELVKFEARSLQAVRAEYERVKDERFTRLHMDHVPVIDEDGDRVDAIGELSQAVELGFDSIMIDGSRLSLADNIAQTRRVVEMAHARDVPVEAELGAVMGHESGPMPPYEELFASGRGFTDPDEARRFVAETGADWLSVAVGSVHGAISKAAKDREKPAARLNIEHLERIRQATGVPLVLHGGSGIRKEYILDAIAHGIAKINIGTAIRQPYERGVKQSAGDAARAVYEATRTVIERDLEVAGSAHELNGDAFTEA